MLSWAEQMEPSFFSGVPRRYNRDGSRNIYCRRCKRFCGTNLSNTYFGSVSACAVCDAAEKGIEIPPEMLEQLDAIRLPGDGLVVPSFVLSQDRKAEEAAKADPLSKNAEDRLSLRHWLRASTLKVVKTVAEKVRTVSGAQQLAREKKLKRVFERGLDELIEEEDKS